MMGVTVALSITVTGRRHSTSAYMQGHGAGVTNVERMGVRSIIEMLEQHLKYTTQEVISNCALNLECLHLRIAFYYIICGASL